MGNTVYQNYPDIRLGVAPYVVGEGWKGGRYTPTGSWAYAASSDTENLDGATELVKWMSGVESGMRIWELSKTFPSTYEAFEQIDVFQDDENYRMLYEQLKEYGHPRPKTPVYPQVSASFQQALESVALSGQETRQVLDKSVERIGALYKRMMKRRSSSWLGMAFFGPALVLLTIFLFVPMVLTLVFSFTDYFALNPGLTHFVGPENYIKIFKDELFVQSFVNTVCFVLIILPCQGAGALVLALLIHKVTHCKKYFKVAFFIPVVCTNTHAHTHTTHTHTHTHMHTLM